MRKLLTSLLLLFVSSATVAGNGELDRAFDQYTWLATHNAFNYGLTPVPNQTRKIPTQLSDGVRGLMLDFVASRGRVYLCHTVCLFGELTLEQTFNEQIMPFLQRNPHAILTLHVEGDVSRSLLHRALNGVPGLADITFDPNKWNTTDWPSPQQMIQAGQRLLIFNLDKNNSGDFAVDEGNVHIMASIDGTVENYWSLGATIFSHDYSCRSRWDSVPLDRENVSFPGKTWKRLFVMNQFHSVGEYLHAGLDNRFDKLWSRAIDYCWVPAGRKPNFVAVDHYGRGDGLAFAQAMTRCDLPPKGTGVAECSLLRPPEVR